MKRLLLSVFALWAAALSAQNLNIMEIGRYTDGRDGASEIVTYDSASARLFITNAASDSIDIVDISTPANPVRTGGMNVLAYGGGVNSVANTGTGYIAAAIEDTNAQANGSVVFFDTQGNFAAAVEVGALPDMLTVSPDGNTVLVACEGEPNDAYDVDPAGQIALIDISGGVPNVQQSDVTLLGFAAAPATIAGAIQKPNTAWEIDLEPEYIAYDAATDVAAVVCQEANALVLVDVSARMILGYKGLGFKDHSISGNGFDASNRDNGIHIQNWNVKGAYQPDAIASYRVNGNTYFVTANEGDGRDYGGYSSEVRVDDLTLDPTAFPNAASLQEDSALGRLKTFTADVLGDTDNDGDVDEIYSYGARSFSIWDDAGNLVWDSGDDFEQYIAANHADFFNCNDGLAAEADERSDDKGPEPEAITVGQLPSGAYAFIALERQGGFFVYNVSDPNAPVFETYVNTFNGNVDMTDIAPEDVDFIPAANSHTGNNMLIVSNEVSGTTTIYSVTDITLNAQQPLSGSIKVQPSVSNGRVQIQNATAAQGLDFQVVSVNGTIILEGPLNAGQTDLDLTQAANGIYFIAVRQNGQRITTEKIMKH